MPSLWWRSRPRRALLIAALVLATTEAAGAEPTFFVKGGGGGGVTDNINGGVDNPGPGQTGKLGDVFVEGLAGVGTSLDLPRVYQLLSYDFDTRQSLLGRNTSYFNTLAYEFLYRWAEPTTLAVDASANIGTLRNFATAGPASQIRTSAVLPPPQAATVLALSLKKTITHGMAEHWTFQESTLGALLHTFGDSKTPPTTIDERMGPVYTEREDSYFFTGRTMYLLSETPQTGELNHVVAVGPEFLWDHSLSTRWSSELNAGVLDAVNVGTGDGTAPEPLGGAAISFTDDFGAAGAHVNRTVQPSLFAAALITQEELGVNASLPYFEKKLLLSASGAIRHGTSIIGSAGTTKVGFRAVAADADVTYRPRDWISFSLRYQFLAQDSEAAGVNTLPSFTRHFANALVTLSWGTTPRKPLAEQINPNDPAAKRTVPPRPPNRPIW